jgi:hypothetical protein
VNQGGLAIIIGLVGWNPGIKEGLNAQCEACLSRAPQEGPALGLVDYWKVGEQGHAACRLGSTGQLKRLVASHRRRDMLRQCSARAFNVAQFAGVEARS